VQGILDFKIQKLRVCNGHALGKHMKTYFPSSEHKSREILDLIHLDVSGTMSLDPLTHLLCLIYGRVISKYILYFMKIEDEVFSKFLIFKAHVDNQTGKKIKVLRSKNGGEYTSNTLMHFIRNQEA
jgi:hypothetical protein